MFRQFSGPEVLCSASFKAKFFAEIFSTNFNLGVSSICSLVCISRTDLKLLNTSNGSDN